MKAQDGIVIVGAACIVIGVASLSPALAWIVAGLLLCSGGVVTAKATEKK